ncbi:hypothetical protein SteCoe_26882 [Stentor coeruleus]|uniref:Uncharacterized protein n=1 Tax=Stentor coeruleus TaxID=5963 RepID=A0A1R2BC90_9CILI|nr:hypothetical protein SteCoe_26882 [Stentor coeruleus]
MGCCNEGAMKLDQESLKFMLRTSIEQNSLIKFKTILVQLKDLNDLPSLIISFPIAFCKTTFLSVPEYCIFSGSLSIFKHIHETFTINIPSIEKKFDLLQTSPIHIMCTKNYNELLLYYLPLSLPTFHIPKIQTISLSFDILGQSLVSSETSNTYISPLHAACEKGHLLIVKIIYDFFGDSKKFNEFNVNYYDEFTGETCTTIACKTGNFFLIKFLHEYCLADFKVFNKYGENALQILCSANRRNEIENFFETFVYLVEVVGIDIVYNFEETLLLCNQLRAIKYFEMHLASKGILCTKFELESNQIIT